MCAEMAHVLRRERFNSHESEETQTVVHDRRVLRAGRGQRLRFHALRVSCAHIVAQQADALYLSHSAMQAEAGVDANLGCNADVQDMYTDDPLTMLCGATVLRGQNWTGTASGPVAGRHGRTERHCSAQ